jgi:hypothetical protein
VPITTEPSDQDGHVERPGAVPAGAPRADAVMVVDEVAKSADYAAGHPSRVRMREGGDKSGNAVHRRSPTPSVLVLSIVIHRLNGAFGSCLAAGPHCGNPNAG